MGDQTHIYLSTEYSGEDLNGLTWYVDQPEQVKLYINEKLFNDITINKPDLTEKKSISIKWCPLTFPNLKLT